MAQRRGGAAAVAAVLVDLGRNGEKEAVGAREGSARRLGLPARPFCFQRALAKAIELAHGITQDAARRIFFTARAILQRLLERVFNHYTRNIGGSLCMPNLYNAC
jgi:hypothetical protein